jgi:hypothetical protein
MRWGMDLGGWPGLSIRWLYGALRPPADGVALWGREQRAARRRVALASTAAAACLETGECVNGRPMGLPARFNGRAGGMRRGILGLWRDVRRAHAASRVGAWRSHGFVTSAPGLASARTARGTPTNAAATKTSRCRQRPNTRFSRRPRPRRGPSQRDRTTSWSRSSPPLQRSHAQPGQLLQTTHTFRLRERLQWLDPKDHSHDEIVNQRMHAGEPRPLHVE